MEKRPTAKRRLQEPVSVNAKLRSAHPWFDEAAGSAKASAIVESRKRQKTSGPKLSARELVEVCKKLEQIQQQLNPLEIQRDQHLARLKAHWGHTGIEEVSGAHGKTLLSLSYQYVIPEPDTVRTTLPDAKWQKISIRKLDAAAALNEADNDPQLRKILGTNAKVAVKLSVISPSSRRPKSGQPQDDSD